MTTPKDHQAAMVELLAHGSAVAPSTLRLAHAMHDALAAINGASPAPVAHTERRPEATTSGLNDAALAGDVAFVGRAVKDDRVSELEEENARLRAEVARLTTQLTIARTEQSGCRKDDTQDDGWVEWNGGKRPVDSTTLIQVRFRNGEERLSPAKHNFEWRHCGSVFDIIAYRVVKP